MMGKGQKKQAPIKKAVALTYGPEDVAPRIIAKGKGLIADKILAAAEENDVAVYEDKKLVDELTKLNLGDTIPPDLYEVVAQILLFISDLDRLERYKKYGQQ